MAEPRKRAPAGEADTAESSSEPKKSRSRVLQEDVPSYSLEQALRVPRAIAESYAYRPTRPLNVAGAMGVAPSSGTFRMIAGAAVAYGLATAGAFAPEIGITPLGLRIVRPTSEGDDVSARREALLRPKIIGEFLRSYDGAALPSDVIAKNVLQEKGVPTDRLDRVLDLIVEGAADVGFLKEYGGKRYVDLAPPSADGGTVEADLVSQEPMSTGPRVAAVVPPSSAGGVSVMPGVHINIEIHIAADASSETIEEIFRNMRRYVLSDGFVDDSRHGS